MYRYIFLLLLITVELFALKVKAKQSGDIVKVRALIKSPMIGKVQATKINVTPDYIKRIVAHVGGEIVYDVAISPSWQRNPMIKFQYKYLGRSNSIEFTIVDNKGKKSTQSFKIKKSLFKSKNNHSNRAKPSLNDKILATDVWNIKVLNDALSKLYNTSKFVKEKIKISTGFSGDYHPDTHIVGISSDIQLKSISVFANIGERPALVAMFSIPKDAIINYRFNLKMRSYSGPGTEIIVVGEGQNGILYKSTSFLGLSYDETRFIKDCAQRNNNLDTNSCKKIANEISLQKLESYYQSLMKTSYLPASRKLLLQQNSWLENRKNICPNFDVDCLSKYYQKRMDILKKTYTKKQRGYIHRDISCESFHGKTFSNNLQVFAGGSYRGKGVDFQIEDSSHQTTEFDVIVNSPNKPVALILGAYDPSVWNIKWTKGTKIEGVLAFGHHKQFVAGLPKDTPILAGNDNRSCDLSNNVGLFFDKDTSSVYPKVINDLSKRVYNKNTTSMYHAEKGKLLFGDKISNETKLYMSEDTPIKSFIDKTKSLYGNEGLSKLLTEGKIRSLTNLELDKWTKKKIISSTPSFKMFIAPHEQGYMILDKISIPINAHAVYILDKGIPYPDVSAGDEPTIYELDTMTCNGSIMSGCKNY